MSKQEQKWFKVSFECSSAMLGEVMARLPQKGLRDVSTDLVKGKKNGLPMAAIILQALEAAPEKRLKKNELAHLAEASGYSSTSAYSAINSLKKQKLVKNGSGNFITLLKKKEGAK